MLDKEHAGRFSRQIELALKVNNFDLARVIVAEAERTSTAKPEVVTLDDHVACMGISVKLINALESGGLMTIRQVLNSSRERLLSIANINSASLTEILTAARILVESQ